MTSGSQLTPWVLLHGCDGFEPVLYIRPLPGHSLAKYAELSECVLEEEQFFPSRGPWSPQGGKRILRVPFGTLTLQVLPQGVIQVWAYVQPACLRRDPHGAAEGARRALDALWRRLPHRESKKPAQIGVKAMTAHADIVGLELLDSMIPVDFDNRTRSRLRAWSDNGRLTGLDTAGGSLKVYDKTAEMRVRRTDANLALRDDYERRGYQPSMGPVWRVEVAYKADRLRRYSLDDLESVFRHGLGRLRLLDPTSEGVKKANRVIHPAWALLHGLSFTSPWEAPCTPPPPLVDLPETRFRRLVAAFLRAVARLAVALGIVGERLVATLCRVVPAALNRWPEARARYEDRVREIRDSETGGRP